MQTALRWATISLGTLSLALIAVAVTHEESTPVEGRLLPAHMRGKVPWKTIAGAQLFSGATLPSHTNVIVNFPDEMPPIRRSVFTGFKGTDIRYWGYCFPKTYDREEALKKNGLPGTIFLSEKEREFRNKAYQEELTEELSFPEDFTDDVLNQQRVYRGRMRHQQDIFEGGRSCYFMSSGPLPVGLDADADQVNAALEKDFKSDPDNPDTDADGIPDGLESLRLKTSPIRRDSDGDGLIDGLEDKNFNGRVDPGETNPTLWDSDRDGLCDGLCKVDKGRRLRGEDKNINGTFDEGEYNPLKEDTDGDGILDFHEVFLCEIETGENC